MKRTKTFSRKTKETDIKGKLTLEGARNARIQTGIGFLDHMLTLFAFHGEFDLDLSCTGDIEVCPHHTIEDIAITLGEVVKELLGDGKGIQRYASVYLPMDETLTRTVLDISGRPFHVFKCQFGTEKVGAFPTEMASHFFYSFVSASGITLHQETLYGSNDHHILESLFKGFARALSEATAIVSTMIPSSKGKL